MNRPLFSIGIDLGTTNCCLAFSPVTRAAAGAAPSPPRVFQIEQRVDHTLVEARSLLPSFIYIPSTAEGFDGAFAGFHAREHGLRNPGRLVCSAKSWLCTPTLDRRAPILPRRADEGVKKISPVDACATFLDHMRRGWNNEHPRAPMEEQSVVITLPASFDAHGRALIHEAADQAGLGHALLLEEPLAAFYAWLGANHSNWRTRLRNRRLVLVCDVGGGTSDFTLISIDRNEKGVLTPETMAVGEHILAGGDNMDQALAYLVEKRLTRQRGELDPRRFASLVAACRRAKESLLSDNAPASSRITVLGQGSSMVGSALSCEITAPEVEELVLEQFFPACPFDNPEPAPKAGLFELGLPYASDPAVTRNIARFLGAHKGARPDAVLFNGGALAPFKVRERVTRTIESWFDGKSIMDLTLSAPAQAHAVALGAATYGLARLGTGLLVRGGIKRSYYVHFEGKGRSGAICLLPAGAQEEREYRMEKPVFDLLVGRPVSFTLYTSTSRLDDPAGLLVDPDDPSLIALPRLHTVIRRRPGGPDTESVLLQARLNQVGTLDLSCRSLKNGDLHRLTFELRREANGRDACKPGRTRFEKLESAADRISAAFSNRTARTRRLGRDLEKLLSLRRGKWSLALCRKLWEILDGFSKKRRKSPAHEETWLSLAGFCLRPGFGAVLDEWRIEKTLPLFRENLEYRKTPSCRLAWWIFWRRAAGGLPQPVQDEIYKVIAPHLLPGMGHLRKGPRPSGQERVEMWRLLASLEALPESCKEKTGSTLVDLVERRRLAGTGWWALGRVGARIPFSNNSHRTLAPDIVTAWLDRLLKLPSTSDPDAVSALLQIARLTGDRDRDLPDETRQKVKMALLAKSVSPDRLAPLDRIIVPRSPDAAEEIFGETLPQGLRLLQPRET